MKIHAHVTRRASLTAVVLTLFKALESNPAFSARGVSKYNIKRTIMKIPGQRSMSINTIKSIVNELVENGTVECVNPNDKTNLRFRLVISSRTICFNKEVNNEK